MTNGYGSAAEPMSPEAVREILTQTFASLPIDGRRVLVIIPDATRSAPIPLMYQQLNELVGQRAARVDYLIALGTHPPMSPAAIESVIRFSN